MAEQRFFLGWETKRAPGKCRHCEKPATAHGYLYVEPPPEPSHPDTRKPWGEVFQHERAEDCVLQWNKPGSKESAS